MIGAMADSSKTRGKSPRRRGSPLQLLHAHGFAIRHLELPIAGLPPAMEGLRLVSVSDLHVRDFWSTAYDSMIQAIDDVEPDLLVLSGDMVNDKWDHRPAWPHTERLLKRLKARHGVYAILGNHDNIVAGAQMQQLGVRVLQGVREVVPCQGGEVELIAPPGPWRDHLPADFASRFEPRQNGVPRLVLSHFPDHWRYLKDLEPDIFVAGHTHAGQVSLPTTYPIMRHDTMPRHQCRGHHRFGRTHYIVNHGFGFSMFRIRLFCPAEVLVLELLRQP
jgi:predicted MPP superfamily phosphohydrolase